jgi:hypothetical protein
MGSFIGRLANVGIFKEAVRGTAGDPTFWLPQTSLSMDEAVEQVINESSLGIIEDSDDANVTKKMVEGTLEGKIAVESFGLILLSAIGSISTSVDDPEAGVQTHTYSVLASAQHPSLTLAVDEPNSEKRYALGMIDSLEITAEIGKYVMYSAGVRAKAGVASTVTPAYVSADEAKIFVPQNGTFKVASDLAGLGAGTEHKIQSMSINIAKNLEDDHVIGDVEPNDFLNKQFSIEGEFELLYRDSSFVDDLLADTKRAMRLTLENTAITIGATTNPKMEIDLANVKFSSVSKPFSINDLVVQTISYKAHYSISDAKMLDLTLINETVSY